MNLKHLALSTMTMTMAAAAPLDDLEAALGGWGVVSLGDFYAPAGSDVEGRLLVVGDAELGSYSVGAVLGDDGSRVDLLVTGDLHFESGSIKGSALVGGNVTSAQGLDTLCTSAGCSVTAFADLAAAGHDPTAVETDLLAASAALAALSATGAAEAKWSTLTLSGDDAALNVFDVTAAQLADNSAAVLDVPDGSLAVINVGDADVDISGMAFLGDFAAARGAVVFNLHAATAVSVSGVQLEGALIAPLADLDYPSGVVYGSVVCGGFSGPGEHDVHQSTGQFNEAGFSAGTSWGSSSPSSSSSASASGSDSGSASASGSDSDSGSDDVPVVLPTAVAAATRLNDDVWFVESSSTDYDSLSWTVVSGADGLVIESAGNWISLVTGVDCEPAELMLTATNADGTDTDSVSLAGCSGGSASSASSSSATSSSSSSSSASAADSSAADSSAADSSAADSSAADSADSSAADSSDDATESSDSSDDTPCLNGQLIDDVCVCWDPLSWRGDACDEDCSSYCNYRGRCSGGDADVCECWDPASWAGDNCEIELTTDDDDYYNDDESPVPCVNGQVVDDVCVCWDSWTGAACETSCSAQCNGRGTCSEDDPDVCTCWNPLRWEGDLCETEVVDTCTNGRVDDDGECQCWDPAYNFGDDCASSCVHDQCNGRGYCSADDRSVCTCFDPARWGGDFCDEELEAPESVCLHGAPNAADDGCDCTPGWTGDSCAEYVPCYYGGWFDGECVCDEGWTGEACAEYSWQSDDSGSSSSSSSSSAVDGGETCHYGEPNDEGGCDCADGWTGDDCNTYRCVYGSWDDDNEECECIDGWFGDDCSDSCAAECGFHGTACGAMEGVCECDDGWSGENCQTVELVADPGDAVDEDIDLGGDDNTVGVTVDGGDDEEETVVVVDTEDGFGFTVADRFTLQGADEVEWTIELAGHEVDGDGNREFTYTVAVDGDGQDLSHFGFGGWFFGDYVTDASMAFEAGTDPTTGMPGIKVDEGVNAGSSITFSFTVPESMGVCDMYYAVKGSTRFAIGETVGPCEPADDRRRLEDTDVLGYEFQLRFAGELPGEPTLVAAHSFSTDGDDCVVAEYDADMGTLTGSVCRPGSYVLSTASAASVSEEEEEEEEEELVDEESWSLPAVGAVALIALLAVGAAVHLRKRHRDLVSGRRSSKTRVTDINIMPTPESSNPVEMV